MRNLLKLFRNRLKSDSKKEKVSSLVEYLEDQRRLNLENKLYRIINGWTVHICDNDDELVKMLKYKVDECKRQSEACLFPKVNEEYKVEEDGYLVHVVRRYEGIPVIAKTYSCMHIPHDFVIAQAQYLCELLNEKI